MHARMYVCMYVCSMYVCAYVRMYACMYASMYMSMYVYMYVYVYIVRVFACKDRWVARIPSSSGCGPGETSGAHAISHCAIQRLLVHTGLVSGGFVSAGPKILRSAQ